jgi:hypothetical protein
MSSRPFLLLLQIDGQKSGPQGLKPSSMTFVYGPAKVEP